MNKSSSLNASILGLSAILALLLPQLLQATTLGFSQIHLAQEQERPLLATLWYPTDQDLADAKISLVADNIAFAGTQVIKNAPPFSLTKSQLNQAPLVLLSHGYRGSWRNLNWLATKLVQKGYLVAAVDHPGTTTFNTSTVQAGQWWQRPRDLSRLLDHLLADKTWQQRINKNKISAIGHSLGGWSVMQLIGAEFNRDVYLTQCQHFATSRSCQIKEELGLASRQVDEPKSANFLEQRIQRAVILDLGLARSFSKSSLQSIKTDTLILGAGIDIGELPQAMESGYLAEHLPLFRRHYKIYEQATHFSFMQPCKANAIAILEEDSSGDGIICKDGDAGNRDVLHEQIFSDIVGFLNHVD